VYSLVLHDDAVRDLDELWDTGREDAASLVEVFLEQAKVDQGLLERLSDRRYRGRGVDVQSFEAFWPKGYNLYRLKLASLQDLGLPYRVLYAFDPRIRRYYVLGVVHRDFDYKQDAPRTQRVLAAYRALDLPLYAG